MAEYIEREFLYDAMNGQDEEFSLIDALDMIDKIPAADVAGVIHGKWTWKQGVAEDEYYCICSNCKSACYGYYDEEEDNYFYVRSEYCHNCGAKMDLEVIGMPLPESPKEAQIYD